MQPVLETKRLVLRELKLGDLDAMKAILQDIRVMYAWEHAFSGEECAAWLGRCHGRYQTDGCAHWAVIERESGDLIGMVGLVAAPVDGTRQMEVGYLIRYDQWGRGFAKEAAQACIEEAFRRGESCVVADIRPENTASVGLAKALGMKCRGQIVKHYYGKDMPHDLYWIARP